LLCLLLVPKFDDSDNKRMTLFDNTDSRWRRLTEHFHTSSEGRMALLMDVRSSFVTIGAYSLLTTAVWTPGARQECG
jgi:hypothetical protein